MKRVLFVLVLLVALCGSVEAQISPVVEKGKSFIVKMEDPPGIPAVTKQNQMMPKGYRLFVDGNGVWFFLPQCYVYYTGGFGEPPWYEQAQRNFGMHKSKSDAVVAAHRHKAEEDAKVERSKRNREIKEVTE